MFFLPFYFILSLNAPGDGDNPTIETTPSPSRSPIPTTPVQTYTRDEGITIQVIVPPDDTTSQGLFIAMIVLLCVVLISIIGTVVYFCVVARNNTQIGAADFTYDDQAEPPVITGTVRKNKGEVRFGNTTVTGTRGVATTRGATATGTRTMKTTTRPNTATTTHAKSIYAVNTVIL